MRGLTIVGTDTNVGKTLLSALIMAASESIKYWKPVQSGLHDETDTSAVLRLSGCDPTRVIPERYRLTQPLSPHLSARLDRVTIDPELLAIPPTGGAPIIIETAGGVLVPHRDDLLQVSVIATWALPVVIATRSSLGTINHSLLTLEALRSRSIRIAGAVAMGEANPENERAIEHFGNVPILGRIPLRPRLDRNALLQIFQQECQALADTLSLLETIGS